MKRLTLYHGTCTGNGKKLTQEGWQPNESYIGSNMGNPKYLYLTSSLEDALWFAQEKGCDTIIEVNNIPLSYLRPDPEDESGYTMEELLRRMEESDLPSKFILTKSLGKEHFKFHNDSLRERFMMKNQKDLRKIVFEILMEDSQTKILYRGVEDPNHKIRDYEFFAENPKFAKDYGKYIYKCSFQPLNLFYSYEPKFIQELYKKGYKLQDLYVEDMWDDLREEMEELYDFENGQEPGYKNWESVVNSPYFGGDTWDMIENSHGVLDYILSHYDGVALLEGSEKTYYLNTDKLDSCEFLN